MSNQEIVDLVDDALPGSNRIAPSIREHILDAIWFVLENEREDEDEEGE